MLGEGHHFQTLRLPLTSRTAALLFLLLILGLAGWGFKQLARNARAAHFLNSNEVASLEASLRLNAQQPEAHSRLGFLYLYDPILFDSARALDHFRAMVRLAPYRFEGWLDLSRAYEQNGDLEKADASLRLGERLAPSYYRTHWRYANFLLRHAQQDAALDEFTRAATINPKLIDSACEIIWQVSGQQEAALREFAERLGTQRSLFAVVQSLANRRLYEQAAKVWEKVRLDPSTLPWSDFFSRTLLDVGRWDLAEAVALRTKEAMVGALASADRTLFNGDFSYPLGIGALDWTAHEGPDVRVSIDSWTAHTGDKSLRLDFINHERVIFEPGVTHWMIVEPSSEYILHYYYKTVEMLRGTGLHVNVLGAVRSEGELDPRGLSNVTPWTEGELRFWTAPEVHTVQIAISRRPTATFYDFVDGRAYFDSFTITRIRGASD